MATILITHGIPQAGFAPLSEHQLIIPPPLTAFSEDELMQYIASADAVVAGGKLPGQIIRAGKQLKIIANYGAGYDGVDIQTAAACGIPVTNIPDTVTQSTAELSIGLMLSVSRRIAELNLRARKEAPESLFGMGLNMGRCLQGQVLGIIGYGRIGQKIARLAQALSMQIVFHDPAQPGSVALPEVLQKADIITLHCPLNSNTRQIINRDTLTKMKHGAILINTSRGGVVDYNALCDALESGQLFGAGIDVYPDEPHIPARLTALDNAVCTPHIGANTEQTRFDMARACSMQILDALQGKRPQNIVNGL